MLNEIYSGAGWNKANIVVPREFATSFSLNMTAPITS